MTKCRMVVFSKPNHAEIREYSMPALEPDELLIRTACSGVSAGTERAFFQGEFVGNKTNYPFISGYQLAGIVEDLGRSVSGFHPGEKVFTTGSTCLKKSGLTGMGGHASHVTQPVQKVYKLPQDIDLASASQATLAGIGIYALEMAGVGEDDRVVVFGLGLLGQMAGQFARSLGAQVIGIDARQTRLDKALECGFTAVFHRNDEALMDNVLALWPEKGTVGLETTGLPEVVSMAGDFLTHRGRLVFDAAYPGTYEVSLDRWHWNEVVIYNANGEACYEKAIDAIAAGRVDPRPLISHRVPYTEAPRLFDMLVDRDSEHLGIVFDWQ